jgi:hypothetical protein
MMREEKKTQFVNIDELESDDRSQSKEDEDEIAVPVKSKSMVDKELMGSVGVDGISIIRIKETFDLPEE